MRILPIAERELRVIARRGSTYWLRCLVALALMFIAAWVFLTMGQQSQRQVGTVIFYTLTGGLTLYALLAGLRSTADCLSEEKREGTLGLLFLTDLRGYDIVIGKLLANSLTVFFAVLAVVPVLAIPLLLGGVTGAEFGRQALVLINTLFFSLSAGMLASAWCKNARVAVGLTLATILFFSAGVPGLGLLEHRLRLFQGIFQYEFLISSPVFSFAAGLEPIFKSPPGKFFFASLATVHLLGWGFLLLASGIVRNKWQDRPATVRGLLWQGWRQRLLEGGPAKRLAFRRRCLDQSAFFWLATRPRSRAWWTWTPLVVAAGIWIWGIIKVQREWFQPPVYAFTAFMLGLVFKGMIGAEAGRQILDDRKIGALELLLATPLSVREIFRGQFLALARLFTGPVAVMLLADLVMFIAGLRHPELSGRERSYWIGVTLAGVVMFAADVVALYWMGMWVALSNKNPRHAFGAAIAPILTLPWAATAVVMTAISLMPRDLQRGLFFDSLPLWLWFGFSLLADVGFSLHARHKLLTEFRRRAAQRYQPASSRWHRWFGRGATLHPPA